MKFRERFEEYFSTADLGDEWVYSNFEESLLEGLDSASAFEMLLEVADFLLLQEDGYLRLQLLNIIISLARKSNTTEMPAGFLEKIVVFEKLFVEDDYERSRINELKRIYRIV